MCVWNTPLAYTALTSGPGLRLSLTPSQIHKVESPYPQLIFSLSHPSLEHLDVYTEYRVGARGVHVHKGSTHTTVLATQHHHLLKVRHIVHLCRDKESD